MKWFQYDRDQWGWYVRLVEWRRGATLYIIGVEKIQNYSRTLMYINLGPWVFCWEVRG